MRELRCVSVARPRGLFSRADARGWGLHSLQSDEVYLEAQIQNIMPTAIYVDRVNLDPSPQYRVIELNRQRGAEGWVDEPPGGTTVTSNMSPARRL